jgi:hypothetical protein
LAQAFTAANAPIANAPIKITKLPDYPITKSVNPSALSPEPKKKSPTRFLTSGFTD